MITNTRSVMGFLRMILVRFPCHPCVLFWQPFRKRTDHGSCLSILYGCNHSICIWFQFSITCMAWFYPMGINIALNRLKSIQKGIPYFLLSWSCLFPSLLPATDRHIPFCLALALIQHAMHTWNCDDKWTMYLWVNTAPQFWHCGIWVFLIFSPTVKKISEGTRQLPWEWEV